MLFIIIIILIPLYLTLFLGRRQLDKQIEMAMSELRLSSAGLTDKIYREEQLLGLPEPVQRYFRNVLQNGQSYVSFVYLKHDGKFKTALDKEWVNIEGEQHFTAETPGFLWKGKTSLFTVQDMYISGKGHIKVSLLNLFKLADGEGSRYDQGELLRWLGESVWFPTNLLPGPRLQWTAIDKNTAKLSFSYEEQLISYDVIFNEEGEITQLETLRYMGEERLEPWVGRVSNYEEIDGMKIPMNIEALWKLDDGEHSYAQFNVREIHYKWSIK